MQADIDELNTESCFTILNNIFDLIKNEKPHSSHRNSQNNFMPPGQSEHDPRNTFQRASLRVIWAVLKKIPDEKDKFDFLARARNEPIFAQHFSTNFYYQVGRTGGQIAIDEMTAQINTHLPCAIL